MMYPENEKKLKEVICALHHIAEMENASALEGLAIDCEIEYMNLINDL